MKPETDSVRLTVKQSLTTTIGRFVLGLLICLLVAWSVYRVLVKRNINELRTSTAHRLEFYRMSLEATLARNESLPNLLALDERLASFLVRRGERERTAADDFLREVKNRADISAAYLMDSSGLTIASSNAGQPDSFVGNNYSFRPYFKDAMSGNNGRFYGFGSTTGVPGYFLTAPVRHQGKILGAIAVKVSLDSFETAWLKGGDIVLLSDSWGIFFLASNRDWKFKTRSQLSEETQLELIKTRKYPAPENLKPLGVDLTASLVPVTLPGKKGQYYLVQSHKVGPLDWQMYLLIGTKQVQKVALTGGVAAGFAMAFLMAVITHFKVTAQRYHERRLAKAELRQAYQELEQRINERTSDLLSTNQSLEKKVNELKTTEDILRETSDNAVQAGKLAVLGQMSAGISHEINQPLTALNTFTDNAISFLERGRMENVRENLGLIRQMADRMGHIVSEVKNFSRKTPAERRNVCLADVLNQTLMLVETERRRVDATIEVLPYPEDLQVLSGPIRLGQVLVNLLRNALDAVVGLPERRITVTIDRNGTEVAVTIRDSGPGIPPEILPRLFEPFFTTKPPGQGLGLGLPISRVIITELGGSLDARNHESGGAEFTVTMEAA